MSEKRIDRILSSKTMYSGKEIKQLIARKCVKANGTVVKNGKDRVETDQLVLKVDGKAVSMDEFRYIMLNKPEDVLSATKDAHAETVMAYIPFEYRRKKMFPAGRLDMDSTGFVLLTDDGKLAHALLSPKRGSEKVYEVMLDAPLPEKAPELFRQGIGLGDGYQSLPATLEFESDERTKVRVTLMEGKYHQIKRMMASFGVGVESLHRISIGGVQLDEGLHAGQARTLTPEEIETLRTI